MNDAIDLSLLQRYLSGDCRPEERVRVDAWIAADPQHASEMAVHRQIASEIHAMAAQQDDTELVVRRFRERLSMAHAGATPETQDSLQYKSVDTRRRRLWPSGMSWSTTGFAIAALVIVAVAAWRVGVSTHSPQQFREFASASGSRTTVTLRDGTRLTLGPATTLKVPTDFGLHTRTVDLQGEAYFAVVHDARHPFSVLANNVRVTDVGTEFDVRDYDADVRVAVARGSVLVGAGRGNGATGYSGGLFNPGTVSRTRPSSPPNTPIVFQEIPLSAGDVAIIDNDGSSVTHHANIELVTNWMQDGLSFEDTPLPAVLRDIGRAYRVTIVLSDSTLAHERLTASFTGQPLDVVLKVVTQVVGARYQRNGNEVLVQRAAATTRVREHALPLPLTTAQADHAHD